jgi:hypothetical protein
MNTTVSDMEIINPPSRKIKAGAQPNGGYPSMREVMNRPKTGDLSSKKLMIVGQRGGITVGVQSSGGASEEKETKMKLKQIKEKTKKHMQMCVECGCSECSCGAKKKMEENTIARKAAAALKKSEKRYMAIKKSAEKIMAKHHDDHETSHHDHNDDLDYIHGLRDRHGSISPNWGKRSHALAEAGLETSQENLPPYNMMPDSEFKRINYQFNEVFRHKFANPYLIVNAVRAILERFSINCPVMNPSGRSEVMVLHVHSKVVEGFVYIAIERDGRGHYDAFVQMVDELGLAMLHNLVQVHEEESNELPDYPTKWILQQRHTGNI